MKPVYFSQSAQALGTTIELRILSSSQNEAEIVFGDLWNEIAIFDGRFSRFIRNSEISIFNSNSGKKNSISLEMEKLLRRSQHFSNLTKGVFNLFVLPGLQRAGYVGSITKKGPIDNELDYRNREIVSHEMLEVGDGWARIPKNSAIDIGGIGKGYLADELTRSLKDKSENFMLSIGGDIVAARDAEDPTWKINIQSVKNSSKNIATFQSAMLKFGLATSGKIRSRNDKHHPHLINPATGEPTKSVFDVCTVAANDTTSADVLASCIIVGGIEYGKELLQKGIVNAIMLQKKTNEPVCLGSGFELIDEQQRVAREAINV